INARPWLFLPSLRQPRPSRSNPCRYPIDAAGTAPMERGTPQRARQRDSAPTHTAEPNPEAQLTRVSELLKLLDSRHAASPAYLEAPLALSSENQLVQVRLGIASALFMSLRCKDPDTA